LVEIEFANDRRARVNGGAWSCTQPDDQAAIAAALAGRTFDPMYPHPDLEAAKAVVAVLGGRVVRSDPAPRHVPGRVY
jgi:hypothetical protein